LKAILKDMQTSCIRLEIACWTDQELNLLSLTNGL